MLPTADPRSDPPVGPPKPISGNGARECRFPINFVFRNDDFRTLGGLGYFKPEFAPQNRGLAMASADADFLLTFLLRNDEFRTLGGQGYFKPDFDPKYQARAMASADVDFLLTFD